MQVRGLGWSDFDSWLALYYTRYEEIGTNPELGVLLQDPRPSLGQEIQFFGVLHRAIAEGSTVCAVADVDGRVVGLCEVHRKAEHVEDRHIGVLGIVVHPDFRGRGLGPKLIADVLDRCRGRFEVVQLAVFEVNERARRIYERAGFEVYGRAPRAAKRGNRYFVELLMWKPIEPPSEI